jgi:ABC-type lipoprotein release transport system permease subunit
LKSKPLKILKAKVKAMIKRKINNSKKGDIEISTMVKIVLYIVGLVVIVLIIYLVMKNGGKLLRLIFGGGP